MSDIEGVDELVTLLNGAASNVSSEVRKVAFKGGMNIKRTAASLASRQLGVDNINMEIEDSGDEISAEVETRGVGGAIMEFGSPTLPGGRPFMTPAFESERESFESYIDQAVGELLQ